MLSPGLESDQGPRTAHLDRGAKFTMVGRVCSFKNHNTTKFRPSPFVVQVGLLRKAWKASKVRNICSPGLFPSAGAA